MASSSYVQIVWGIQAIVLHCSGLNQEASVRANAMTELVSQSVSQSVTKLIEWLLRYLSASGAPSTALIEYITWTNQVLQ